MLVDCWEAPVSSEGDDCFVLCGLLLSATQQQSFRSAFSSGKQEGIAYISGER